MSIRYGIWFLLWGFVILMAGVGLAAAFSRSVSPQVAIIVTMLALFCWTQWCVRHEHPEGY